MSGPEDMDVFITQILLIFLILMFMGIGVAMLYMATQA